MARGETWHEAAAEMWRKLHLAVDASCGMIVAQTLTDQDADDPSQVHRSSIRLTAGLSG
jgi:hypothetical protein